MRPRCRLAEIVRLPMPETISYILILTDDNYIFADGSDSAELNWSIAKKQLRATWSDIKLFENSSAQYPTILKYYGL